MPRSVAELEGALAEYIDVLADAADRTHATTDRPAYQSHLAQAARMFAALRGPQPVASVKAIVAAERHAYGRSYLSDESGQRAEKAFHTFALVVEQAETEA